MSRFDNRSILYKGLPTNIDVQAFRRDDQGLAAKRPLADSRKLTGVLNLWLPDKDRVVTFYYRVIRAWEQPVEPLLTGSLATLPMAPLADVADDELPELLERIDSRLTAEAPAPEAARIMASTLTLAGMRLRPEEVMALGRRLPTMNILKDSSFYHAIVKEGLEEGLKKGLKQGLKKGLKKGLELGNHQGRIAEAREVLFRQGRIRFGRLDKASRARIEAVDDLKRLEHLSERLLAAVSWADLLAESE